MEWFLGDVCTPHWNIEQDRGRDWDEAVALLMKDHPRIEVPDPRLSRALGRDRLGSVRRQCRAAGRLRDAGVPNYCITNFSGPKFALSQKRYPFLAGSTASLFRATSAS